jgi:hypothetical protein
MQNSTQSPACSVHGLHRKLSSYWLAHFYLMKKAFLHGAAQNFEVVLKIQDQK